MCLAIPGKIIKLKEKGKTAVIDYGKEKREATNIIKARVGDYVLVQHRIVVEKVLAPCGIRAVIFDFGGVIVGFKNQGFVRETNSYLPMHDKIDWSDKRVLSLFKKFEKGFVSERQFFESLSWFMKEKISFPRFRKQWNNLFVFRPEIIKLIKKIREKGYKTGLVSNINETHYDFVDARLFFGKLFDAEAPSFKARSRKPEKKIFETVLNALGEKAENCVYIDDLEEFVLAARKFGFNAIQYRNFGQLKKELSGLGVCAF